MPFRAVCVCVVMLLLCSTGRADGLRDNNPDEVRPVPRLGIELDAEQQKTLADGLEQLDQKIKQLSGRKDERTKALLPDVLIFQRAVRTVRDHQEFFAPRDVAAAAELLEVGKQRAEQLLAGEAPWTTATGLVVRGYISKIDHTVQPYGLVVPETYGAVGTDRVRLDIWFHGRGETLSEVNFLDQRRKRAGHYEPVDTIVLHPYGRYSNAFKFAGEVDVLEALQDVQAKYRIDADRISVRGFSMGGAACWQFAVHYADRWFAANPGAGFSETPEFLKFFQKETLNPRPYERKLWQLYDCPDYAANLRHCPTVAYSGELDIQKQAADIMEAALRGEGIRLQHIIGPQTKHSIHADSKRQIEWRMAQLAQRGRRRRPSRVELVTYTLKYNRMHWLTVEGLSEHWKRAEVEAEFTDDGRLSIASRNVSDLAIEFAPGELPARWREAPVVTIAGEEPQSPAQVFRRGELPLISSDASWQVRFHWDGSRWNVGRRAPSLRKRHGVQGPIDDAFMDSFIFVLPSGHSTHDQVDAWVQSESQHAIEHWRKHFRGDARVKKDREVTEEDHQSANLVLFGDASSNALIAETLPGLPLKWDGNTLTVGPSNWPAGSHVPVLIYPNPRNPHRYVVLNSGFTFREYDYLNNARQVPKLPDWAVIDIRSPVTSQAPGKVVAADFFDEQWRLKK